ncbi:hypothetical protein G9P44_003058 [Scheffersomyces stipitis]|nr:hypothetical protein G9P44_003058 [Scheffersomyces stipitis]
MYHVNANYTPWNLLAFNFTGFACVAIVVFLSSTQPFYVSEVIGIQADAKIGAIIGTLGFTDELVSIISSPLVGTLTDKLNSIGIQGTRYIPSISFLILALSLVGYAVVSTNIYPDVIFFRCIFALGVTSCMSMITVMLNELTNSDFAFQKFLFWRHYQQQAFDSLELNDPEDKKNGKYSALIGISTGLGAIFSVSFFLTLPIKLVSSNPDLTLKEGLKYSYLIVAAFAVVAFHVLVVFLYDSNKKKPNTIEESELLLVEESEVTEESDEPEEKLPYFKLLARGFEISRSNHRVQLSYIGAFVARSTTVTTSVFIPLLVYNFYYKNGKCNTTDFPNKKNCNDGYIFSAILTGVAQTIALISSPLWGYMIDSRRVGKFKTLLVSAIAGIIGNFGLCISGSTTKGAYDPHTVICFVMVSLIGMSQIGIIITSMSVLSGLTHNPKNMGSLSGLYSLSGGLGILLITKVGGLWSDYWILGPFFLLGAFNTVLLVVGLRFLTEEENLKLGQFEPLVVNDSL